MAITTNVPSNNFEDLQRDVQDATRFTNATSPLTNRAGQSITPIPMRDSQLAAKVAEAASAVEALGWFPVAGSFADGGTITARNQVLFNDADGSFYSWSGELPKVVPAASTPASTGGISANAWANRGDAALRSGLAAPDSSVLIAGVTAAQVALAADIAVGNFVTPDQFFTGDPSNQSADYLAACQAALATGRRVLLRKMYGLSGALIFPQNRTANGLSRNNTGFFRLPASIDSDTTAITVTGGCSISNFKVDANNLTGSGRCNAVITTGQGFSVQQVDVYNATGYGHFTNGSELNADAVGTIYDCYAENCQVSFEQIGALDVSLYKCRSLGVNGRTFSHFHPYAGSKIVSYRDCIANGPGVGVDMTVTNNLALGPFVFDNVQVFKNDTQVTVLAQGTTANTVNAAFLNSKFINTGGGASLVWQTAGKVRAFNSEFSGAGGFNGAGTANNVIELTNCDLRAEINSSSSIATPLITNSAKVSVSGGSLVAINTGSGGAVAWSGPAPQIYNGTTITPAPSVSVFQPLGEVAGVASLSPDGTNEGFFTFLLPVNVTNADKVIVSLSIMNTADTYLASNVRMSWRLLDVVNVRVRVKGDSSITGLKVAYRAAVLP